MGSVVAVPGWKPWQKTETNRWESIYQKRTNSDASISVSPTRVVLRYGQGNEQPVWRIEHDWRNLRVGEYIIDIDGDTGTVHKTATGDSLWCKGGASTNYVHGSWIVFPSKDVATPEAIEEAKNARDKEMDK